MNKIKMEHSVNGDSRFAKADISFEDLQEANDNHRNDILRVLLVLGQMLTEQGAKHDWSKKAYEQEFYDDLVAAMKNKTDFTECGWYKKHVALEKHHPFSSCHEDITLLDIIECIADCVCAGKTRSGQIRPLEFDETILKKAIDNTVKLIDDMTEVEK